MIRAAASMAARGGFPACGGQAGIPWGRGPSLGNDTHRAPVTRTPGTGKPGASERCLPGVPSASPPSALIATRRRDSTCRRRRVLDALGPLAAAGRQISVSAVARAALLTGRSSTATTTGARRSTHAPPQLPAPARQPPPRACSPCSPTWPTSTNTTSGCRGRTTAWPPACPKSSAPRSFTKAASGTRRNRPATVPGHRARPAHPRPAPATRRADRRTRRRARSQLRPHRPSATGNRLGPDSALQLSQSAPDNTRAPDLGNEQAKTTCRRRRG
jgi:hypothetical protein